MNERNEKHTILVKSIHFSLFSKQNNHVGFQISK